MRKYVKKLSVLALLILSLSILALPALAAPEASPAETQAVEVQEESEAAVKAMPAGIAIGLVAMAGALAMGLATYKAVDSIARQPEAESKIRTALMLGLVFIETAIIYALLVVILIIFVL